MIISTKEKANAAKCVSKIIGKNVLPCMLNEYRVNNKVIAYIFFFEDNMYVINSKNEVQVYVPR